MANRKKSLARDAWLTLTLTKAEKAKIGKLAERHGMTASSYARMKILFPARLEKLGTIRPEDWTDDENATGVAE